MTHEKNNIVWDRRGAFSLRGDYIMFRIYSGGAG
jgi:hypothetical protein